MTFVRRVLAITGKKLFNDIFPKSFFRTAYLSSTGVTTEGDRDIQSMRQEVNGVNFHYEKTGTGKHVLLLLPGALGSTRTDFGPQLETLDRNRYTLIAFDPRGYGKSIPPERDWPLEHLQRDAEDAAGLMKVITSKPNCFIVMMKGLGIPQYSIVGFSDGGITGIILSSRYPQHVHRFVMWGANAYITEKDVEIFNGIKDIDSWSERMKKPFLDLYGEEYFRKHWALWVEAFGKYYTQRKGDVCIEDCPRIKCPTLIIHGEKDPIVPREHPEYLLANIKNSRFYSMPEGKHNLNLRYPEEFKKVVEGFLNE